MSDEWISHADLVEAVGEPAALVLCACRGGQSLYIPHAPEGCALSAMLGQDAAERLCAVWGGLNVIVPNLRRGGPLKPEMLMHSREKRGTNDLFFSFRISLPVRLRGGNRAHGRRLPRHA